LSATTTSDWRVFACIDDHQPAVDTGRCVAGDAAPGGGTTARPPKRRVAANTPAVWHRACPDEHGRVQRRDRWGPVVRVGEEVCFGRGCHSDAEMRRTKPREVKGVPEVLWWSVAGVLESVDCRFRAVCEGLLG
jgi:hypothetical protein